MELRGYGSRWKCTSLLLSCLLCSCSGWVIDYEEGRMPRVRGPTIGEHCGVDIDKDEVKYECEWEY